MILTGNEIKRNVDQAKIDIRPFCINNLTTNSFDITLGDSLIYYNEDILDPKKENKYTEIIIPDEGVVLQKNNFYLGHSAEIIGSDHFVPIIHAKSGIARLGLFVHVTADLIDIGYHGNITFQLYPTIPIKLYKGMRLAQVSFWVPKGDITLYEGKYQNGKGAQTSKTFKDFA